MSHLGPRVTALVDGQLRAGEAERALAHAVGCPRCARDLAEAREARRALSNIAEVVPDPSLTARLLAMSLPEAPVSACSPGGDPVRRDTVSTSSLCDVAEPGGHRRRRGTAVAGVAACVLAGGLFVAGEGSTVTPNLHPAEPLSVLARADDDVAVGTVVTASGAPLDGSGLNEWATARGWRCPERIPAGFAVADVRLDGEGSILEVDLTNADGPATIVVREEAGRLDAAALAGVETRRFGDREVYVVSSEPWHLVWQSGSTVVDLVADASESDVVALVTAFPDGDYDSGIPARIGRGWTLMTGAIGIS